jgi:protein-disulfide isomerase
MTRKFIRNITASAAILFMTSSVFSAPPAKSAWLSTVTQSNTGGHIIGNPAAATKVVEYASYTCGHCATFEGQEAPLLKSQYIANGKVSFEVRNLVRDPIDLTVAVMARCGGKAKFFGNHKLLMASQKAIMAKAQSITSATEAKLNAGDLPGFLSSAYKELGLASYMTQRGITPAQANACLADKSITDKVIAMTEEATGPLGIAGTPSFLVNGKLADDVHDLTSLKPFLAGK